MNATQTRVQAVIRILPTDTLTPVSALMHLRENQAGPSFLLESCGPDLHQARYSFLGTQPQEILSIEEGKLYRQRGTERECLAETQPLQALNALLPRQEVLPAANLDEQPPLTGGYIGYLGYDCVRYLEALEIVPNAEENALPEACLMRFESLLIFDHLKHRILLVTHIFPDAGELSPQEEAAQTRLDALQAALHSPLSPRPLSFQDDLSPELPGGEMGKERFFKAIERIQEAIHAGESFQTVISERFVQELQVPAFDVYRVLRSLSPSPYLFYLDFAADGTPARALLGASPEMLLRADNGQLSTHPIAGTRPRGKTPEADQAYAEEMLHCEKERAEHLMLVDLGRNDIGRVALPGSVQVSRYMEVQRFSHVMHLVSEVQGQLAPQYSAFEALLACFPAGTLSGAPKVRAMELIAELEPFARGWYGGCIFYHGFNGNLDSAITIRSLAVEGTRATIQAGAGIVADSQPEHEYKEVRNKARAMLNTLAQAEKQAKKKPQATQEGAPC